jgi:hypothetical protein
MNNDPGSSAKKSERVRGESEMEERSELKEVDQVEVETFAEG